MGKYDKLLSKKVKRNIQILIENGQLDEARSLINQYKNIEPNDIDVFSIEGILYIIQEDFDKAEKVLKKGLYVNEQNFDINYNLAYLYEMQQNFDKALTYYDRALNNCKEDELRLQIKNTIEKLEKEHGDTRSLQKTKLAFFVKTGMDSFINDIINELFHEYDVRKIVVTEYKQIDEGMKWSDICWFEWCDELVAYGSKLEVSRKKKIICRLHRYEALTEYPKNVMWENVDKLIIVTNHLKKFLVAQIADIGRKVDIVTINNGVDLDKFNFKDRSNGFNIAYIGYIHQRKNPILLLQIMSKIVENDKRYKLYIAGKFQDGLMELYWNHQVQQMGLQNNIVFQGWQDNIEKWLEDKNYIISTSIHESFGYGIAEAMARGIKPIIHNFPYSDEIWSKQYLFNKINEAVDMIKSPQYDSKQYRKFIEQNYSLDKQMKDIRELIGELQKTHGTNNKFQYLIEKFEAFGSYTFKDVDKYEFKDAEIKIGKIEQLDKWISLIEFIIGNKSHKQLLIQNVYYDSENETLMLPDYISKSLNNEKVVQLISNVLSYDLKYDGKIAGFVNDIEIKQDIIMNNSIYMWERGIPATQFMPSLGYLKIIERYMFASQFIDNKDTILEAACGFGYGAAYFSKYFKQIYALDLASDNIEFARQTYGCEKIKWINGDVTKLPFENNKFDVYTSFETFEHIPLKEIDQYFKESVRVLKKHGRMILSTPNADTRRHINNPYHIKEYTYDEFNNILRKYFKNIEYYSVVNYEVEKGFKENCTNMIAICSN